MSNKLHSKPPRNPIADNSLFPASISISLSCLSLKIKFLQNFWELFDLFCLSYFNCCLELIFYFINFFLFIEQGKSFFSSLSLLKFILFYFWEREEEKFMSLLSVFLLLKRMEANFRKAEIYGLSFLLFILWPGLLKSLEFLQSPSKRSFRCQILFF